MAGACLRVYAIRASTLKPVVFLSDGTLAAFTRGGSLQLWNVAAGTHATAAVDNGDLMALLDVADIESATVSFSGTELAVVVSRLVLVYDIAARTRTLTFSVNPGCAVAMSPRGNLIAHGGSTDDNITVRSTKTGQVVRPLRDARGYANSRMRFSPDGSMLVSVGRTFVLWDVDTGARLNEFYGDAQDTRLSDVTWLPCSDCVVITSYRHPAYVVNVRTGACVCTLAGTGCYCIVDTACAPDGTSIAFGTSHSTVEIFDPHTGAHVRSLAGHTDTVYSVAFSPDSALLASAACDNTVRVWRCSYLHEVYTLVLACRRRRRWLPSELYYMVFAEYC